MLNIIYFYNINSSLIKNIPIFLIKEGFKVYSSTNIEEAEAIIKSKKIDVIITDSESNALLISRITGTPLVLVLEEGINQEEVLSSFRNISNPVFIRYETDSIETIINTVSFCAKL